MDVEWEWSGTGRRSARNHVSGVAGCAVPCYPLASLIRRGIVVAGSSDRPVVEGAPLLGIHDAVNQRTGTGAAYALNEALSPADALALFTRNAAHAAFEEDVEGTLTVGKLADFVVLAADPAAVRPEEIGTIPVVATFVGGVPIVPGDL